MSFGDARDTQKIINVDLNKEVRKSFLDYSMTVITSRALPDVRAGCSFPVPPGYCSTDKVPSASRCGHHIPYFLS